MTPETWQCLRTNEPDSYEQLIENIMGISRNSSPSERTISRDLVAVFAWCRAHRLGLAELVRAS